MISGCGPRAAAAASRVAAGWPPPRHPADCFATFADAGSRALDVLRYSPSSPIMIMKRVHARPERDPAARLWPNLTLTQGGHAQGFRLSFLSMTCVVVVRCRCSSLGSRVAAPRRFKKDRQKNYPHFQIQFSGRCGVREIVWLTRAVAHRTMLRVQL